MHAGEHRARPGLIVRLHPAGKSVQQARRVAQALAAEAEGVDHAAVAGGGAELADSPASLS